LSFTLRTTPDSATGFGDYCIDVEGKGICAFDKSKIGDQNYCDGNDVAFTAKKFGSATTVEVCANTSLSCDAQRGVCVSQCGTAGAPSCTQALGGKVCNATTHKCECGSGADCGPGAPNCNLVTKQCECGDTNDCSAFDSGATLVCE